MSDFSLPPSDDDILNFDYSSSASKKSVDALEEKVIPENDSDVTFSDHEFSSLSFAPITICHTLFSYLDYHADRTTKSAVSSEVFNITNGSQDLDKSVLKPLNRIVSLIVSTVHNLYFVSSITSVLKRLEFNIFSSLDAEKDDTEILKKDLYLPFLFIDNQANYSLRTIRQYLIVLQDLLKALDLQLKELFDSSLSEPLNYLIENIDFFILYGPDFRSEDGSFAAFTQDHLSYFSNSYPEFVFKFASVVSEARESKNQFVMNCTSLVNAYSILGKFHNVHLYESCTSRSQSLSPLYTIIMRS